MPYKVLIIALSIIAISIVETDTFSISDYRPNGQVLQEVPATLNAVTSVIQEETIPRLRAGNFLGAALSTTGHLQNIVSKMQFAELGIDVKKTLPFAFIDPEKF